MHNLHNRGIDLIRVIIFVLIIPSTLFGEESGKESQQNPKGKSDFTLTVKNNLISLNAKDASLKNIVEEIARRMKIDVIANFPGYKKVSIKFDTLSLSDAIERLRKYADIVYFRGSDNKKITKIMVFPKRKGEELSTSAKEGGSVKAERKTEETLKGTPQPEPFKFEFDPSKYQEKK